MTRSTETDVYRIEGPDAPWIPLLVSVPHAGTRVPDGLADRFADDEVRVLPDTDWFVDRIYDFVPGELGGRLIVAEQSRYVVDLNRPAEGGALYPGRDETTVVPVDTFGGRPIYRAGAGPDTEEVADRVAEYWRPYHARLHAELDALRARFGYALLWDGHSIVSRAPRFFEGELPLLMLGDAEGAAADPALSEAVLAAFEASGLSFGHNHPFKGGYITRSCGRPADRIHALQLETSQRGYMDEAGRAWDAAKAARFRVAVRAGLEAFVAAAARLLG